MPTTPAPYDADAALDNLWRSSPAPLELASAARRTACWVRHGPDDEKIPNILAVTTEGWHVLGNDPRAVRWCALGYLQHLLGSVGLSTLPRFAIIVAHFNAGHYDVCARELEHAARILEQDAAPPTPTVETPEPELVPA